MKDRLTRNQSLQPGQEVIAGRGNCKFSFQGDGNVVLYRIQSDGNWHPYWSPQIENRGASTLVLQDDGNLVAYTPDGQVVWSPQTENKGVEFYVIQDDENFVAYRGDGSPVWSTNTANPSPYVPGQTGQFAARGSVLGLVVYCRFEVDCNGFHFWGDAGGISVPGLSELTGTIQTDDFNYMVNATQGFSFTAAAPYLQINFIDPNENKTVGVFHAANIGTISGGGAGAGRWQEKS